MRINTQLIENNVGSIERLRTVCVGLIIFGETNLIPHECSLKLKEDLLWFLGFSLLSSFSACKWSAKAVMCNM